MIKNFTICLILTLLSFAVLAQPDQLEPRETRVGSPPYSTLIVTCSDCEQVLNLEFQCKNAWFGAGYDERKPMSESYPKKIGFGKGKRHFTVRYRLKGQDWKKMGFYIKKGKTQTLKLN